MGEAGAQDGRADFTLLSIGQAGGECTGLAAEARHPRVGENLDIGVIAHARDHAADGVPGPLARGHQLGVAGQDRRTAKAVGLVHQDHALSRAGQRVGSRESGWTRAHYQYRGRHEFTSICAGCTGFS